MSGMASALVAPGAIVAGKYRLEAIVGEGGMGSVWSATHTGLGQAVAIKFISREFVASSEALRRFDAEAKAAAQLASRHVVQVFDNGTLEDGTPYIAMELLRGENLYARVHRGGPVPLKEAVEILAQCCKALGRAHGAGIVHRDIKPDNIFLAQSADDDAFLVKVLDFGIAKFAVGPNDHGATRTGAVLGTPLYMSPEQARGLKSIDHRTDLYSLGLVAYTMFTGNLAFSSESFGDLLLQICTAPLPSLCANAPWLPPSMELWFQQACAREPQNRFASAQAFVDALRAASDGPARAATQGLAMGQSGAVLAAAVSANPAHAVSVGADVAMSRSEGSVAVVAPPKGKGGLIAAAIVVLVGAVGVAALLTLARRAPDGSSSAAAAGASPTLASAASSTPAGTLPVVTSPAGTVSLAPIPTASAGENARGAGAAGQPSGAPETPPAAANQSAPSRVRPAAGAAAGPRPNAASPAAGAAPKPIDLGY